MASNTTIALGALWLADGFLALIGDDANRLALDRIRREIDSGATDLDRTVAELSSSRQPRPGEFGLELVGPAVLAVLLPALKTFFDRYIQKVVEGGADRAASFTLDQVKKLFRREVENKPLLVQQELEKAFAEHAEAAGIGPENVARFLELVKDHQKLASVAETS